MSCQFGFKSVLLYVLRMKSGRLGPTLLDVTLRQAHLFKELVEIEV